MAIAIAMACTFAACSSGTDHASPTTVLSRVAAERRDAAAWSAKARTAYRPLRLTATELPSRVRSWQTGERPDEELRNDLATSLREVSAVRDAVEALPPFARDAAVRPLYRWSSQLYVEHVHGLQAALAQPAGPMRDQLVLLARRVRVLADRVFDRGQSRLAPFLHEAPDPNVEIHLPPEVPDWVVDGLAAGPPLDDPPPPAATEPALREDTRPTQPRRAWVVAVAAAGAPSSGELSGAITSGDQAALRALARRFADVARALAPVPDPADRHGRDDAAQVRLSLLVSGEAARAAQAGLGDVARRLLVIADRVWAVPGLPRR
ncbi:MAG: hypothetical protein QOJ09_2465 [Actinomycetota bacterium]|jgi:hypothetical protein|nr:hypothetical protein [Actinomycetota bacterium]